MSQQRKVHENESDIRYVTSWSFDYDSEVKTFVIFTSLLAWMLLFTCCEESKLTIYYVPLLVCDLLQLVNENCLRSPAIT